MYDARKTSLDCNLKRTTFTPTRKLYFRPTHRVFHFSLFKTLTGHESRHHSSYIFIKVNNARTRRAHPRSSPQKIHPRRPPSRRIIASITQRRRDSLTNSNTFLLTTQPTNARTHAPSSSSDPAARAPCREGVKGRVERDDGNDRISRTGPPRRSNARLRYGLMH